MKIHFATAVVILALAFHKFYLSPQAQNSIVWPEVDISLLRSDNATSRQAAAQAILAAGSTHGFFFLKGHGATAEELESVLEASRQFFALPLEVKQALAAKRDRPGFTRGYLGLGTESGSRSFEVKEAFSFGYDWPDDKAPTNALNGPNVWPNATQLAKAAEWRAKMQWWYKKCVALSLDLARGFALALGLEEDALSRRCGNGAEISLMRLFHYFPADYGLKDGEQQQQQQGGQERIGSSAHTDWGLLTIILQDSVGGLQAYMEGRGWTDVPVRPGTLVVNIGDYTSLVSRGRLASPLHRVTLSASERFSIVHFAYPDFEATMDPLPGVQEQRRDVELSLLTDQSLSGDGAKVAPASFGAYIAEKWRQVQRKGTEY